MADVSYEDARDEHTAALRAWFASRGDDEPAARERLRAARRAHDEAYIEMMGWRLSLRARRVRVR